MFWKSCRFPRKTRFGRKRILILENFPTKKKRVKNWLCEWKLQLFTPSVGAENILILYHFIYLPIFRWPTWATTSKNSQTPYKWYKLCCQREMLFHLKAFFFACLERTCIAFFFKILHTFPEAFKLMGQMRGSRKSKYHGHLLRPSTPMQNGE